MLRAETVNMIWETLLEHPGEIKYMNQLAYSLVAKILQMDLNRPGTGYRYISPMLDQRMDELGMH